MPQQMGFFERFVHRIQVNIAKGIRAFTAYSLILVFIGQIIGIELAKLGGFESPFFYITLFLAVLAYFFTGIAVALFLVFTLLMLILLI